MIFNHYSIREKYSTNKSFEELWHWIMMRYIYIFESKIHFMYIYRRWLELSYDLWVLIFFLQFFSDYVLPVNDHFSLCIFYFLILSLSAYIVTTNGLLLFMSINTSQSIMPTYTQSITTLNELQLQPHNFCMKELKPRNWTSAALPFHLNVIWLIYFQ